MRDGIEPDITYLNALEPYVFSVLTQSLMLHAPDKEKFIEILESKIGLKGKVIFEYINKRNLLHKSKLFKFCSVLQMQIAS